MAVDTSPMPPITRSICRYLNRLLRLRHRFFELLSAQYRNCARVPLKARSDSLSRFPGAASSGSAGPRGDVPRALLLGGAPRSGKSSAARRLAERLGYDTVCIDDLVAAVRAHGGVAPENTRDDRNRPPRVLHPEHRRGAVSPRDGCVAGNLAGHRVDCASPVLLGTLTRVGRLGDRAG